MNLGAIWGTVQGWVGNNGVAAGGIGVLMIVTLAGFFIKKIDWTKLFKWAGGLGIAFDKVLVVKFDWLDDIIVEAGILGIVPIAVGFYAGMIGANKKLKARLKKMLLDLADALDK